METAEWILIIDDDAGIRETTRDILEARGYRIVTASSGLEGLELMSRLKHDWAVALVDMVLPDIAGLEVIEKIREHSSHTQVIIMTGFSSVDSAVTSLRANVIDYLQKPVDMDYLFATIERTIVHRKRLVAEERVRQAALEWRLTFDTIPDVILVLDAESRVVRLNRAAAELIGLPFNEVLGRSWFSLLGLPEDVWNLCPVRNGIRDELRLSGEFYLQRFRKHFLIVSSAIANSEMKAPGTVHILREITPQKELQARFLQSEKLAAVGQLAAGVAHEVNNPLAFIMTNLGQLGKYVESYKGATRELIEMAKKTGGEETSARLLELTERFDLQYVNSDVSAMLDETLNGLVRIRNIVADLRKLSYMGDDDAEEVDLNRLAASAANIVRNEIELRGELRLELGRIPTLPGIPGRLYQVILNLLLNSAHALDQGERDRNRVTLATGQAGNQIFLRVTDTGVGIPAETLDRIFDPFFTTKRAGEGSGLGLAICQDIAHKHNGRIAVTSELGQGAVFTLWLPVESRLGVVQTMPAPTARASMPAPCPQLLIVDDEPEVLKSLLRVLGRTYQLTTVNSAAAALAALEANPSFDLIVSDLVMRQQNGQELYVEACSRWPELEPRFLFFTGGAFDSVLRDFQIGMGPRVIHKPLKADEILAVISDRLSHLREDAQ